MAMTARNPKGQAQRADVVIIPRPAKKTNVPRRGKRKVK